MPSPYSNRSSKKPKPRSRPVAAPKPTPAPKPLDSYKHEHRHPSGREWDRIKANVISTWSGICHLCDHPGAKQIDHVEVYGENQDDSIPNLRPAHGSAGIQKNSCPVCGINCNNVRGALSVEAGRRKIAKRMLENGFEPQKPDDGRDW